MKTQQHQHIAELARTLGHAHRLNLLEQIASGELAVEQLAQQCELSVANASQHLQHLRRAGFVQTRRDGKRVLYRLSAGPITEVLAALGQLAAFNRAAIRELMSDSLSAPEHLEAISREELLERLQDHSVTLLDVRPAEEFAQGHLPGAINIPFAELQQRLGELPVSQEVVAYCRGPWCVFSRDAVTALKARGLRARHFLQGIELWPGPLQD
ncbi:ArsR/SmtB family transcription factor [Pseudomonas donghuensis]|uniref:Metalloregulator ArsR/SmtB family transcription factor n=1 Tax=Pseudomonas donghuensis TaxID=1163398 RepID=A0AAP0SKI9_9PSED|nr:metalloregulator ArsR/SmtB family transcription factor [Pseudomonas donghuensis]KDO00454.2 metalloregulator ArsR/SmtB family transcription factor [Pseudomonas donghuensis]MCP6693783.1 metalloregulator ArsR/SmtB family transcription factor [Pseudomonas donghuensis]MDF9893983.1 rhodanese-related sulfurtransferase/DNA-binding HxlR family transcriptional regulator [Pseudomonas vranovensis]